MTPRPRNASPVVLTVLAALTVTLLLCGCPAEPDGAEGQVPIFAQAGTISVLVSEDLGEIVSTVVSGFTQRAPSISVTTRVAPAAELRDAIINSEAEGYLIAMGPAELTPLDQADRIAPGSRVTLADVPLCVIAPESSPLKISTLEHLAGPDVSSIALGDKDAGSVGAEAKRALSQAKVWAAVEPKAVRVPLERLAAEVAEGRVDAAIVARHQANIEGVTIVAEIDPALHEPIQVLAIRTSGYEAGEAGGQFAAFLGSADGRRPLVEAGLTAPVGAAAQSDAELLWFCGAGLRAPADECITRFREKTGITIRPTYTGSGCLLAQITMGQTGDLYMPGEDFYMEQAYERGFVKRFEIVSFFVPVIMVEKGNPKGVQGLADLYRPGLRVGIGEVRSCAIGEFTPKVLEANGLSHEELRRSTVVFESATAPELGNAIKLGAIDAAIQWDAVASWYLDDADIIAFEVTEDTISPIPLGVLSFSKHPAEAEAFLDFVASDEGRAIFAAHSHTVDPAYPVFPVKEVAAD